MSNNACKDWGEFSKLQELPLLEELLFVGNPLEETHTGAGDWRKQVANRLKGLKKLDGEFLIQTNRTLMHFTIFF
jgi:dynein light chain 1, axonemal